VVSGLTKTLCAAVLPLAGDCSVKAVPTAAPVSASTAVAGTLTTMRCLPTSPGCTERLKPPSVPVVALGSPVSQAPLSFRS